MAHERSSTAVGFTFFAGVMLFIIGFFQAIAGLTAILKDGSTVYAKTSDTIYSITISTATWGWIHLLLGIVVFLAGFGVLTGKVWARVIGVIVASISAVANFAFIPIYPVWAITIIAIDIVVIWALTAHGRDITTN
jgi:hypothetical protein